MKIAYEASVLMRQHKTGVDHYAQNLCQALVDQLPSDSFTLPYISFATKPAVDLGVRGHNVKSLKVAWLPGRLYHLLLKTPLAVPFDLLAGIRADVFIFPNFIRWPLLFCKRSVAVIHDLAYEYTPEHLVPRHRLYLSWAVPRTLKKVDYVIAVSKSTKNDIVRRYNFPADRIIVAYPAIDPDFFKPCTSDEILAVRTKYHLPDMFVLCVATLEPRKNLVGLLKAFDALPTELKQKYGLVLAGGKGWLPEELEKTVTRIRQTSNVCITGYIEQADLPALYSAASVFAFVPFYEGFGMPALEAMACGTPVITSNNSSLPEVVGEAGITVTASQTTHITKALAQILTEPGLAHAMVQKGLEQARKFRWNEQAQPVIAALDRLRKKPHTNGQHV